MNKRLLFFLPKKKPRQQILLTFGSVNAFLYSNPQNASQTFLIDCGAGFNEEENGGMFSVVPEELRVNWQKIKAVILSHAHQDHWSLLRFKPPGIPVYCTSLVRKFIESQIEFEPDWWGILRDIRVFDLYSSSQQNLIISLDSLVIEVFPVPHSVPESAGFYFSLGDKKVMHLGEFKFQGSPEEKRQLEASLRRLGKRGVDLLVIDIQNIGTPGFTPSEQEALEGLSDVISKISGRVFVTCFSSNLERISGLAQIALDLKRPIAVYGTGMTKLGSISKEIVDKVRASWIFLQEQKSPPLALISGSQAEEGSALWKEAFGLGSIIRPGDTLIFSSKAIPGPNEKRVREAILAFQKRGVQVIVNTGESRRLGLSGLEEALVHASGHASLEDVKLALRLLNPRYVIPRPPVSVIAEQLRQVSGGKVQILSQSVITL